ncbi:P-loop containing nucleoside triphosphate hydrolase protein [Fusarium oxysporum]|nr:P-loop containing nucleoside triphosphate hydrolase protein [Fusarium oxysporum]
MYGFLAERNHPIMFSNTTLWLRQIHALTRKIFLITVLRHWRSTILRALVIPILILVLVLQIRTFTENHSQYGVGKPLPIQTLSDSLPDGAKLMFVRSSNSGPDVSTVIKKVTGPLGNKARVETVENETELLKKCPTSLTGATDCYAAIIFNDSPLSPSGDKIWNYTIRVSSARSLSTFNVNKPPKNDYAPLQLAVENAMTNSSTIPNSYMYTRVTQDEAEKLKRPDAAALMLSGAGLLCFLSMISSIFHITGMIATEREAGMAQLIDIMTGGVASARALSYVIAFDIIYFPSWCWDSYSLADSFWVCFDECKRFRSYLQNPIFRYIRGRRHAIIREKYSHGVSNKGRKFTNTEVQGSTSALKIDNLTKTYKPSLWKRLCCCGRYRPTVAVDSLSFVSQKHQVLCLLGVNGSGKTTTLGLISGTQALTSGSININAPRSKLVLEHAHLWTMMKGGLADTKTLNSLVESCDLLPKKNNSVGTLSGGQMRKVQLLCMLAGDSSICLMDEVTTGMDPVSRRAIWNIILAERSKRSMILTTHFLDECEVLADKIVIVSRGHLRCQGSTAALKSLYGGGYRVHLPNTQVPPDTPYHTVVNHGQTVMKTPDSTTAARLLASLETSGYADVSLSGPTMEDVFFNVADEVDEVDQGTSDVTPLRAGNEVYDGQLSSSTATSNLQQLWALLLKRILILKKGFWWYILVLAIPLIFTPIFTADINNSKPFEPISCINTESAALERPYPVSLRPGGYSDKAGADNISMLVGPRSINTTLFRALSSFPFAEGYDIGDYKEHFLFQNDLDAFLQYVHDKPRNLIPGALYIGDKSNTPTFAYNAMLGSDTGMLIQNMLSQVQSNMSIALLSAYFSSSIPSDAGPGLKTAIWYSPGCMFPVMLLYGLTATLWGYIVSLFARSELSAFGITLCASLVMFAISVVSMMLANSHQNPSDGASIVDATVYSLGVLLPVANLFRAMVVGLNVWAAGCRDDEIISYPGAIHAYGGPILLLCLQVMYLFTALLWLEGQNWSLRRLLGKSLMTSNRVKGPDASNGQNIEMGYMTSQQMSDDLAKIDHIYKTFGSHVAVDDVSLTLGTGEILALLGPNGAGKTTTIGIMRGEIRPDHGSICIKGVDIHKDTRTAIRNIGFCPQFDALDQLTVRQQLALYARVKGIRQIQKDVDLVMHKVGLMPYASRLTSRLSGGNKRKLSLAIALLGNPPILILDEPSSAMDIISKRDMWSMLSSISTNRSVLLTTHSMEEADVLATQVAILSKKILAVGATQELRKRHSNSYEVHLVLTTSPTSDEQEMQRIEVWVRQSFPGASFRGLNLGGQIRFSIPAQRPASEPLHQGTVPGDERSQIIQLIEILEEHKDGMGIAHYTVGMGTLESVFLKIMEEHDAAKKDMKM